MEVLRDSKDPRFVLSFEVEDAEGGERKGGGTLMAERSPLLHRHGLGGVRVIMTPGVVEEMAQLQQQALPSSPNPHGRGGGGR
jgi:hypothetical protein